MSRYRLEWNGHRIELRDRCTLGRDPECEVTLSDDSAASRRHAVLTVCAHGVVVEDLDSKNGVWIDGVRLLHHQLVVGSQALRIGRTDFRLVDIEAEQALLGGRNPAGQTARGGRTTERHVPSILPPEAEESAKHRASGYAWAAGRIHDASVDDGGEPGSDRGGMEQTG